MSHLTVLAVYANEYLAWKDYICYIEIYIKLYIWKRRWWGYSDSIDEMASVCYMYSYDESN